MDWFASPGFAGVVALAAAVVVLVVLVREDRRDRRDQRAIDALDRRMLAGIARVLREQDEERRGLVPAGSVSRNTRIRLARALVRACGRAHEVPDERVRAIAALPLPEDREVAG